MVAVVAPSPEEAEIAVSGALPDRSYRPFPGSVRERELEEERECEDLAALDTDKGSVAVAGSGSVGPVPRPPVDLNLPRIGVAYYWKRSARELALLTVRREDSFEIIALGTVASPRALPRASERRRGRSPRRRGPGR